MKKTTCRDSLHPAGKRLMAPPRSDVIFSSHGTIASSLLYVTSFVFFEKILLVQLLRGSSDKKKLDDRRPPQFFPSDAANSDNRII